MDSFKARIIIFSRRQQIEKVLELLELVESDIRDPIIKLRLFEENVLPSVVITKFHDTIISSFRDEIKSINTPINKSTLKFYIEFRSITQYQQLINLKDRLIQSLQISEDDLPVKQSMLSLLSKHMLLTPRIDPREIEKHRTWLLSELNICIKEEFSSIVISSMKRGFQMTSLIESVKTSYEGEATVKKISINVVKKELICDVEENLNYYSMKELVERHNLQGHDCYISMDGKLYKGKARDDEEVKQSFSSSDWMVLEVKKVFLCRGLKYMVSVSIGEEKEEDYLYDTGSMITISKKSCGVKSGEKELVLAGGQKVLKPKRKAQFRCCGYNYTIEYVLWNENIMGLDLINLMTSHITEERLKIVDI